MAGRVTRRREQSDARRDLDVTAHAFVARALEIEPLGDRVALVPRDIPLGPLHEDRHAGERRVLTGVIEVEVRVDHRAHEVRIERGRLERLADRP